MVGPWQSGARRGDEGDGTGGGKGGHSRILAPGRVGEAYVLVVRLRSGAAERVDFFFQERLKVGWNTVGGASEAKYIDTYIFRTSSIGLALMFEESKQRLLNGVSSMAREMKSPKISKHVPPFVHAVINPNRNRKEGSTPRSVYYTILVSTNASPPPQKKKKDIVPPRLLLTPSSSLIDLRAPPSVRACHLRPVRDHAAEIQGLRPRRPRSVSAATARTSPVPYLFY